MNLVLGVCGSIAAYKAADIAHGLVKRGVDVRVVMTADAAKMVSPQVFQALTHRPVLTDLFDPELAKADPLPHITLGKQADLILIAPATANMIGKIANGISDDALSTLVVSSKAPLLLAPAMHDTMWQDSSTQANVARLKERGVQFVGPEVGALSAGDIGEGRMSSPDAVVQSVLELLGVKQDFKNRRVLVAAGGTREAIDPVRFLGNRSSGKMGFALAEAASQRGAQVTLVKAVTSVAPPPVDHMVPVETADQMRDAILMESAQADVVIMAAAVSDFRPTLQLSHKRKRSRGRLSLRLAPTRDILEALGKKKGNRILVGFAAETDHVLENAKKKLKSKNLDMIVANDVTEEGAGFESDTNIVTIISKDGSAESLPRLPKLQVAHRILDRIAQVAALSA